MLTMEYIKENEKTYQVQIEELTNRVEYEQRRNQRKDKEIERLNNIINELEKYLYEIKDKEIERLNKTLEDIDTYIHLWKLEEIGEKTMLILNDILLIKNGMSDEVVRLKDSDKE